MNIKSEEELRAVLNVVISDVINKVSDRIIELLKENIKRYAVNQPSDWYERTGEFENAFIWQDMKVELNGFSRKLIYDPSGMHFDPDTFTHGSPFGGDATATLMDILNVEGFTSSLNWKFSHPYWSITISQLIDGRLIDNWFKEEFRSAGLILA